MSERERERESERGREAVFFHDLSVFFPASGAAVMAGQRGVKGWRNSIARIDRVALNAYRFSTLRCNSVVSLHSHWSYRCRVCPITERYGYRTPPLSKKGRSDPHCACASAHRFSAPRHCGVPPTGAHRFCGGASPRSDSSSAFSLVLMN